MKKVLKSLMVVLLVMIFGGCFTEDMMPQEKQPQETQEEKKEVDLTDMVLMKKRTIEVEISSSTLKRAGTNQIVAPIQENYGVRDITLSGDELQGQLYLESNDVAYLKSLSIKIQCKELTSMADPDGVDWGLSEDFNIKHQTTKILDGPFKGSVDWETPFRIWINQPDMVGRALYIAHIEISIYAEIQEFENPYMENPQYEKALKSLEELGFNSARFLGPQSQLVLSWDELDSLSDTVFESPDVSDDGLRVIIGGLLRDTDFPTVNDLLEKIVSNYQLREDPNTEQEVLQVDNRVLSEIMGIESIYLNNKDETYITKYDAVILFASYLENKEEVEVHLQNPAAYEESEDIEEIIDDLLEE